MILSVPSYIIPGTYLENAEHLARSASLAPVSGIELLFFFYNREIRLLFDRERERLEGHRSRYSFTIHLPDTLLPEHRELVEATLDAADHYILHPPRDASAPPLHTFLPQWRDAYGDVFLLENTRMEQFSAAIRQMPDIPVCCDTGHLLLEGNEPAAFLDAYGPQIREIHLHGLKDGRDHQGFSPDAPWFSRAASFMRRFGGVINAEVFSEADVLEIIRSMTAHQLLAAV